MGAEEENRLTLEGLAHRLEVLERENERMRSENAELRQEVSVMGGSQQTQPSEVPASQKLGTEFEGHVSRRDLLSKAGAATVAAVAAGSLLNARTARAHDLPTSNIVTHWLRAENDQDDSTGFYAVLGKAKSDSWAAIEGQNFGSGPGVRGTSESSAVEGIATGLSGIGVQGLTQGSNGTGVKGTGRYGVWGESNQAGFYGVTGRNNNTDGTGVWGVGALRGVKGESTDGIGVLGESSSDSLGAIEGHNDGLGSGVVGVGRVGMLGFSHKDGWPAVWGRHTGNWAGISGDSAKGVGVYGESSSEGLQGVFGRAKGTSQGVAGEALTGTGVLGNGKTGVVGASTGAGYGGQFQGGKAQLRLVPTPAGSVGPPTTGAHAKGEVYMDSTATVFVCVAGGNPATWRKVSTTAV